MQGYSANGRIGSIPQSGIDITSLAARFLSSRVSDMSGVEVKKLSPGESVTFNVNGARPKFEQWSVIPAVPGTVGTVWVYHGSESAEGVPTLQLEISQGTVSFRCSPGSSGAWGLRNNTGSTVFVSLQWRENE